MVQYHYIPGNTLLHSLVQQSANYANRIDYESILHAVWEAASLWAEQMIYGSKNQQLRALEQDQMQINLFRLG